MLAILGASGNISGKLARTLFEKGSQIRVIGRSEKGLKEFIDKGVQAKVGDPANEEFLTDALSDAKAAFIMTPPDYSAQGLRTHYNRLGQSIAGALQSANVRHVVNLSCMGAHIAEKVGPIKGLYDQELRLNTLKGINIVHLRPAYLMENLLGSAGMIVKKRSISSSIKGDVKIPMVASADVAKFASELLLKMNFSEKSEIELFGGEDISLDEAVKVIGEKTNNHNLRYEYMPYGKVFEELQLQGMSEDAAHCIIEFSRAINEGLLFNSRDGKDENNTGTTSFEKWAETFADQYNILHSQAV